MKIISSQSDGETVVAGGSLAGGSQITLINYQTIRPGQASLHLLNDTMSLCLRSGFQFFTERVELKLLVGDGVVQESVESPTHCL